MVYPVEGNDGGHGWQEFDTMEEAQALSDSLGGKAAIYKYVEALLDYEIVVYPMFEV